MFSIFQETATIREVQSVAYIEGLCREVDTLTKEKQELITSVTRVTTELEDFKSGNKKFPGNFLIFSEE
jgi:hypothetical protein